MIVLLHGLGHLDVKSICWRDDGRRAWAEWGAWPCALVREGKLPRSWWKRPEYAEALSDWAAGRLP